MIVEKKLITACVVSYNQEQYIYNCLSSVLSQDNNLLTQIVYVDDCSSDSTYEIATRLLQQTRIPTISVRNVENLGAFKTFNLCHSLAENEYVCHLDGDDFWYRDKVARQYALMSAHPSVSASWHYLKRISRYSESLMDNRTPSSTLTLKLVTAKELILKGSLGATSSLMYRKEAYREMCEPFFDHTLAVALIESHKGLLIESELGLYLTTNPQALSRNGQMLSELYYATLKDFYDQYPSYRSHIVSRVACMAMIWSKRHPTLSRKAVGEIVIPSIRYLRLPCY